MSDKGVHKLEWSVILTVIGICLLFAMAVGVTLIAPDHIDPSWKEASSVYQVQMYEVSDPNVYVSTSNPEGRGIQYVYHLKNGFTLHAFQETEIVRIIASKGLERYVTRFRDEELKLTSRVLLLRNAEESQEMQEKLKKEWKKEGPAPFFQILELYDPKAKEAFAITETDGVIENWVDENFVFVNGLSEEFALDDLVGEDTVEPEVTEEINNLVENWTDEGYEFLGAPPPYFTEKGVIYINNPREYRVRKTRTSTGFSWIYDENGEPIKALNELKEGKLRFLSRQSLIQMGENIYRTEGCWYCHTDQTRTLIQDTVLNGSASYPAPPSSANEYIFQRVTFPGTRRIGPDLSRVGIKRPHRDWHMSHFWSPQTESSGSIMPSFAHFFDDDPSGQLRNPYGIPNFRFEAIFQYLMTKGTRITSPNKAWWLGKDPIQTIDIIEGRK